MCIRPIQIRSGLIPIHFQRWVVSIRIDMDHAVAHSTCGLKRAWHTQACQLSIVSALLCATHTVPCICSTQEVIWWLAEVRIWRERHGSCVVVWPLEVVGFTFSKILLVVLFMFFTLVMLNVLCIQSITIHTIHCCARQSVLHLYCSSCRSHLQRIWPYLHKSTCACQPEKFKVEKQLQTQSKLTWPSLLSFHCHCKVDFMKTAYSAI